MNWNIVFFEIALVALLLPVGISLFVVLTGIRDLLKAIGKSLEKVNEMLSEAVVRDRELQHRFDIFEERQSKRTSESQR